VVGAEAGGVVVGGADVGGVVVGGADVGAGAGTGAGGGAERRVLVIASLSLLRRPGRC